MSHLRVKTSYKQEGIYGSTEVKFLYCDHNNTCNCVTFYDEDGHIPSMSFCEWVPGNDLWDAMNRLWYPFKDDWFGDLKDGVEYYYKGPWEE